ncbi:MAG: sigma 54-interacting transcriptional regulator [Nitrospirota bacterium]
MAKLGVQQQLAFAVALSVVLAALAVCATLFVFSQQRSYRDTVRRSTDMIEAASLAFSQAMADRDDVLLDALLHELQSRRELAIMEAYVVDAAGRVAAHSRVEEYGKSYPVPPLVAVPQPARLSEVADESSAGFRVISLLQTGGQTRGALVVTFSTSHLASQVRSELLWIVAVTVPILLISGVGVMAYGRRMANRLQRLETKALAIGRGEWGEPLSVTGHDEISRLTAAFNRMSNDLAQLRSKDRQSAETIAALNRDLTAQLEIVGRLKERLADENVALREQLRSLHTPGEVIGANGGLRDAMDQARQVASLPITVLITGESGTGKELLATFLHQAGARSSGPLIKVNCAALPPTLIESELFGHERGAFTGAVGQKKGKFELAHGGTLLLDEIGELPIESQAKLLRALQQGEIQRIGSDRVISVDVRVIAATNRNLSDDVKQGRFREDLYYRLKVVEIRCPPLRERLEDLPVLAQHFVEHYSRKLGKPVLGISPSALGALASYHWPGNVRELENVIARAVALSASQVLGSEDVAVTTERSPKALVTGGEANDGVASAFDRLLDLCAIVPQDLKGDAWQRVLTAVERLCLQVALETSKNQKEAAEALGLTQTKLHRLIRKYGLKQEPARLPGVHPS